ncbi:IS91 family transposase [Acidobacteriota bacterium]
MVELADIIRRHGPEYRQRYGQRLPTTHRRAMDAVEQCRTQALGGHVYRCKKCGEPEYSYHSCKNRHCPKCQNEETKTWQEKQKKLLLPVTYFLVTFTLPEELRAITRSDPRILYGLLFRASAQALMELAKDGKYLGGKIGMVGVLHTWSKEIAYHPHVHYLVPSGALSSDCTTWLESRYEKWLLPVKALSKLFRGKFRSMVVRAGLKHQVARKVWRKKWIVHSKPVGAGNEVIKYLAPYVRRVAITNRRIKKLEHGRVTFEVKSTSGRTWERRQMQAQEFIRRFLLHVLPKGFQKIRYYGFLSPGCRSLLRQIKILLGINEDAEYPQEISGYEEQDDAGTSDDKDRRCRTCGGKLIYQCRLLPINRGPPRISLRASLVGR